MKIKPSKAGFTLTEMIISSAILVMVVAAGMAGFAYMLQNERASATQSDLDIDVRTAINRLTSDMRLSAMDRMFFYPAGQGPYWAISFPMATNNGTGLLSYGTNGLIQWNQTVIYHVWSGQPSQLRKTVFSPRNVNATDAQRQTQLNNVVANGNGSGSTLGSESATTTVIFDNLVQWNLYGQHATFDGYNSTLIRNLNANLGTYVLSGGSHQFKFTVTGKNPASSGYKVGLDSLVMSPCGVEREAEAQLPVTAQSGATATADYVPNGAWSGNYRLLYPATATGQYFTITMENDRWEETNFGGAGSLCDNTVVAFDDTLDPKDFIVRLPGPDYAWKAEVQTMDVFGGGSSSGDTLRNCAVRVLLRGSSMMCGNGITLDGSVSYVCFWAASNFPLRIMAAYIAECSDMNNYNVNAAPTNSAQLFFGGSSASCDIPSSGFAWAWASSKYQIDHDKSYLISFLVANDAAHSDAHYWTELHNGAPGCWILPLATAAMTADANWNSYAYYQTNLLFGVYGVYTTCPTNGTFTSQIVDTHQNAPSYSDVNWSATVPSGASVAMRVRSGNQPDLSDAPVWTNVTAVTSPGSINPGNNRYVQFQAQLRPDSSTWNSPELKNVTIRWAGVASAVNVGGTFSQGPDHGIFELTVDGNPVLKGCNMDLTIYKDVYAPGGGTRRITSTVPTEIYPRNTGK
ncbi:MAG: prepilin-type N-terminal cleavage/methylation domain-containing protein [Verrucomicrobia bacterium]|nr:MAG: prepilin-type N-terminal cleavage/methylation domain-containing protein [Verrucomicrobiota bacterium]